MEEQEEKLKRIWDNYQEIGEVRKAARIKLVFAAAIRDGVRYINIREFYRRGRTNTWLPSKDGITIPLVLPIEKASQLITPYVEVIEVLKQTADYLVTMDLADPEKAVYMPVRKKVKDEDKSV